MLLTAKQFFCVVRHACALPQAVADWAAHAPMLELVLNLVRYAHACCASCCAHPAMHAACAAPSLSSPTHLQTQTPLPLPQGDTIDGRETVEQSEEDLELMAKIFDGLVSTVHPHSNRVPQQQPCRSACEGAGCTHAGWVLDTSCAHARMDAHAGPRPPGACDWQPLPGRAPRALHRQVGHSPGCCNRCAATAAVPMACCNHHNELQSCSSHCCWGSAWNGCCLLSLLASPHPHALHHTHHTHHTSQRSNPTA